MADRVVLHIGAPKSGSTFVQSLLWKHRAALRDDGLLVPGRAPFDHNLASIAVRTDDPSTPMQLRAAKTWERLVGRARAWDGTVVLSNEWFCWAGADQVERALADLAPTPVDLVFTARPIVHQVPAAWQEVLKIGSVDSVETFVDHLDEPGTRWSWSTIDPAESLLRWARSVPSQRVHLVTVPPRGADPDLLWERVCQVLGIDATAYDARTPHANESLGVEAAALLQRIGTQLREAIDDDDARWIDPYRWLRDYLGHQLLVPRGGDRIALPEALVQRLAERARHSVDTLGAQGYDVVGSLDDLLRSDQPPGGRSPEQVSDGELLDVALPLVAELLGEVRRQTRRAEAVPTPEGPAEPEHTEPETGESDVGESSMTAAPTTPSGSNVVTAPQPSPAISDNARLVVVVGSGRSGTSSVSGTLKYLGLHVPQPEVQADRTNPRGFFEPEWVVDFHNDLMTACKIDVSDSRPLAAELAAEVGRSEENRGRLQTWLDEALSQADELVVKDPRTTWFQELWRDAARPLGVAPSFLTMLRHPAEVSGSRLTHYSRKETPQARRIGNIGRVAGWVNINLASELGNRADPRVFVRYADLLGDWRATMLEVHERLDLASARDLDWAAPHEVDEFLDPDLRRHEPSWDDIDVPEELRDLAEQVWVQLGVLVESGGRDATAEGVLDSLRDDYAAMCADAEGLAKHSIKAAAGTIGPGKRTRSARRRRAAKAAAKAGAAEESQQSAQAPRRRFASVPRRVLGRLRSWRRRR